MKNTVIYVATGAGALALSLSATMVLEQSAADDSSPDIKETTNIAADHPERTARMKAAIEKWKIGVASR